MHTSSKEVLKKVEKMQAKTDHVLVTYGIPETEKVIQGMLMSRRAGGECRPVPVAAAGRHMRKAIVGGHCCVGGNIG